MPDFDTMKTINSFEGESKKAKEIIYLMVNKNTFRCFEEKQYLFNKLFYGMV